MMIDTQMLIPFDQNYLVLVSYVRRTVMRAGRESSNQLQSRFDDSDDLIRTDGFGILITVLRTDAEPSAMT